MSLETATYVDSLVVSNPDGTDQRSTADDHLRLIKACLKRSFPQIGGAVSASAVAISYVNDLSASAQAQLNSLREGSATANNAVSSRHARSASDASNLGGFVAAAYPRLAAINTFTTTQQLSGTAPVLILNETDAATDSKRWDINLSSGSFRISPRDDGGSLGPNTAVSIERTGTTVDLIRLLAGAITFNGVALNDPILLNGVAAAAYARLDNAQTFAAGTGSTIVAMTDGATITPNCNSGNVFRVVLGGNRTMAAPSNARSGQTIVLHILQDGTGSRTLAWNAIYKFGGSVDPTLTTAASSVDVFAFNYDSVSAVWRQAGLNVG